jgi:hypothetical protein
MLNDCIQLPVYQPVRSNLINFVSQRSDTENKQSKIKNPCNFQRRKREKVVRMIDAREKSIGSIYLGEEPLEQASINQHQRSAMFMGQTSLQDD